MRWTVGETDPRAKISQLEFGSDLRFQTELRRRVDAYFEVPGRRRRDCWQMYLKSAIILSCFAASYIALVFYARTAWQGLPLAVLLAFSTVLIGFNIQHDAGHLAYSERRWVNRLMAMTMDMIGASSFDWFWKHAVIHHRFVNIMGYDNDSDIEPLGRLTPHQPRRRGHRWQHFYLWPVYGLEVVKLQLIDDFRYVITRRVGPHLLPRARGWDLVVFLGGKIVFFGLAFGIPLLRHSVWTVLFYYLVTAILIGVALTLIFVLPHLVGDADFPLPDPETKRMEQPWAVHQVRPTLDFARASRVWTWLLGGLNFHKEHHLFPTICHINYPGMSRLVEETCREFGIEFKEHPTFRAGLAAHYRWVRRLGSAD